MSLDIFLSIEHEMLAILAHIRRFLVVVALHATVLGPCEPEPHAPSGMDGGEEELAHLTMEEGTKKLEFLVGITQSVAMGKQEYLAIDLGGERLLVQDNATLLLQVVEGPDVVIACEVVYLNAHIRQFGQFA